jgi:hypothetical protein
VKAKQMKTCFNHPDRKSFSICHGCRKDYCAECLYEGREYYYCKNPECQELLKKDLPDFKMPKNVICPNCETELKLSGKERISGKIHCPKCESLIDFTFNPPQVTKKENYVELLSSLNQGDIGLIKSILDDSNIDFYILGENFLSVSPLLQPARFYVNEKQVDEAKELLKDFDLSIWGASNKQYD